MELGDLADHIFRGVFRLKYSGDAHLVLQTKVQANPLLNRPSTQLPFSPVQMVAADASLTVPMFLQLSDMKLNGIVILLFTKDKGLSMVFRNDPLDHVLVTSTFDSIPAIRDFLQCQIEKKLRQLFCDELPAIIHTLSLAWTGAKKSPKVRATHLDFSVPAIESRALGGSSYQMPKSIPNLYRNQSFTGRGQLTPFTPAIAQAIYKSTSLSALDLAERKAKSQSNTSPRASPKKTRKKHSIVRLRAVEPVEPQKAMARDTTSYFTKEAPDSPAAIKSLHRTAGLAAIEERLEKSPRHPQMSDQQKVKLMHDLLQKKFRDEHYIYMTRAIEEAKKSKHIQGAFCVGCVIVKRGVVISTGFSRELDGNTHAEQCALEKLRDISDAEGADMYTTMEPCSERLSGNVPCTQRIIRAKIGRIYQAAHEPVDFVKCIGVDTLRRAGVEVHTVVGFEDLALRIARGQVSQQRKAAPRGLEEDVTRLVI